MDKNYYLEEITQQLTNNNTYELPDKDPLFSITRKIEEVLDKYLEKEVIDKSTYNFLRAQRPITPVFYILPKDFI